MCSKLLSLILSFCLIYNPVLFSQTGTGQGLHTYVNNSLSLCVNGTPYTSSTILSVSIPGCASAGQLVIMYTAVGIGGSTPAPTVGTWTTQCTGTGTTWQGGVYSHTLTSGDLIVGSLTATQPGGFDFGGGFIIAVFISTTGGIRETDPVGGTCRQSGASPNTLSTTSGVVAGDRGIFLGSVYGSSVALSISPGVVQSPTPISGTDGSSEQFIGTVNALTMPAGVTNVVYTMAGSHFVNALVIVEP